MKNTKEDAILLALLEDKIEQCQDHYVLAASAFLDLRQRALAEELCRRHPQIRYALYGGYEAAERRIAVFFPDYIQMEAGELQGLQGERSVEKYFRENQQDDPLAVIRAKTLPGAKALTHRDYLGSLMGLGLKRGTIGDILARPDGADILVLREMADFLLLNYEKAGRVNLELQVVPGADIAAPESRTEERSDTVASLRLDNITASLFSTSRGKAGEAVKGGMVYINGLQALKPDAAVKEGDKVVFRGKGKAVLTKVGGQTRKDRICITFQRYV